MELIPKHFLGEVITVDFDRAPATIKNPCCPQRFTWRDTELEIVALIEEWRDPSRKGRMARNQREAHLRRSRQAGSWGVGRVYFRVRVQDGRHFDIYYDRAPAGGYPQGRWFLFRELAEVP